MDEAFLAETIHAAFRKGCSGGGEVYTAIRVMRPTDYRDAVRWIASALNQPKLSHGFRRLVVRPGREPEVDGQRVPLPRGELVILNALAQAPGVRVPKEVLCQALWGKEQCKPESIEPRISRLRRTLTSRLGYNPIDTARYLGYLLVEGK